MHLDAQACMTCGGLRDRDGGVFCFRISRNSVISRNEDFLGVLFFRLSHAVFVSLARSASLSLAAVGVLSCRAREHREHP